MISAVSQHCEVDLRSLLQLHRDVHQADLLGSTLAEYGEVLISYCIGSISLLLGCLKSALSSGELTFVVVRLQWRHFDPQYLLRLGRQLLDNIFLEPPQHQSGQFVVQILDLAFLVGIGEVKVVGELD